MAFMKRFCRLAASAAVVGLLAPAAAHAQSGLITKATNLPSIKLSSGQPLTEKPYEIEAGKYYRISIECDGSDELAVTGPEFFRNVWVNEIVVNDVEIRPLGVDSIEFDSAGKATITFIPIRPGKFTLHMPGSTSEEGSATFNVK